VLYRPHDPGLLAMIVVVVNFTVDILYVYLTPRIRIR
jgi:ABC-type dipeptide/oligopeptide/nickel transport system permease component